MLPSLIQPNTDTLVTARPDKRKNVSRMRYRDFLEVRIGLIVVHPTMTGTIVIEENVFEKNRNRQTVQ